MRYIRTLLPELRLSLLHRSDDHVTDTSVGETVQVRTEAERLDNEERLGARVIRAVQHGAGGQTERDTVLVSGRGSW